jgi:hypothetical protein
MTLQIIFDFSKTEYNFDSLNDGSSAKFTRYYVVGQYVLASMRVVALYRAANIYFIISRFQNFALRHYSPFYFLLVTCLTSAPLTPSSHLYLFSRNRGSQLVDRSVRRLVTIELATDRIKW